MLFYSSLGQKFDTCLTWLVSSVWQGCVPFWRRIHFLALSASRSCLHSWLMAPFLQTHCLSWTLPPFSYLSDFHSERFHPETFFNGPIFKSPCDYIEPTLDNPRDAPMSRPLTSITFAKVPVAVWRNTFTGSGEQDVDTSGRLLFRLWQGAFSWFTVQDLM